MGLCNPSMDPHLVLTTILFISFDCEGMTGTRSRSEPQDPSLPTLVPTQTTGILQGLFQWIGMAMSPVAQGHPNLC